MNPNDQLPDGFEWYKNQIAGHNPSVVKDGVRQIGIIQMKDSDHILKFVQDDKRGKCELNFYESVTSSKVPLIKEFAKFLPTYYGQRILTIGNSEKKFMELEDILKPFAKPCVMDVKMGQVSYDPLANEQKRILESAKCPSQQIVGFRVLGYKMNVDCDGPTSRDRDWGKCLTEETIPQAFEDYLLRGWPDEAPRIIAAFIEHLKTIRQWFEIQQTYHFYASSLLLVYEGQTTKSGPSTGEGALSAAHSKVDVRMIDFSHIFSARGTRDDNYVTGLDYILNVFQRILDKITGKT